MAEVAAKAAGTASPNGLASFASATDAPSGDAFSYYRSLMDATPEASTAGHAYCSDAAAIAAIVSSTADPSTPCTSTESGTTEIAEHIENSPLWTYVGEVSGSYASAGCEPGDLIITHDKTPHIAMYVGNEVAQARFPGTDAVVFEAGAANGRALAPGLTANVLDGSVWRCLSFADGFEPDEGRIGVAASSEETTEYTFVTERDECSGEEKDAGDFPSEDAYKAWKIIKGLHSRTSYLFTCDFDLGKICVFHGEAGHWECVREFDVVMGTRRYFGAEWHRHGPGSTPIGIFHVNNGLSHWNGVLSPCMMMDQADITWRTSACFFHGFIEETENKDPSTWVDVIGYKEDGHFTRYLNDHASAGCIEATQENMWWMFENVFEGEEGGRGTPFVVFTDGSYDTKGRDTYDEDPSSAPVLATTPELKEWGVEAYDEFGVYCITGEGDGGFPDKGGKVNLDWS